MPHADNRQKKARKVCGLKSKPWKVLEETGKLYRTAANFPILIFEYQLFKNRMSQRDKCLYFFSTTYLKDKKNPQLIGCGLNPNPLEVLEETSTTILQCSKLFFLIFLYRLSPKQISLFLHLLAVNDSCGSG